MHLRTVPIYSRISILLLSIFFFNTLLLGMDVQQTAAQAADGRTAEEAARAVLYGINSPDSDERPLLLAASSSSSATDGSRSIAPANRTVLFDRDAPIFDRGTIDWKALHTDQYHFPPELELGFATAEYQDSGEIGCPHSQWARWEQTRWQNGEPHIRRGQRSGRSNDSWRLFREDIELMSRDFHVNAFRFSIDWSCIEPTQGTFNDEALNHYAQQVDALQAAGIRPMITLHHFVHPQWFEDLGAFEKAENIPHFVRFSQKVFEMLGNRFPADRPDLRPKWCTINEPTIYMFGGYLPFNCVFPPGKGRVFTACQKMLAFNKWPLAVRVLRNLMQAHTDVYRALKEMPGGREAQIGLVHQYLKFSSYYWCNPLDYIPGFMLNTLMNDTVLTFLKTGVFSYGFTGYYHEEYRAPQTKVSDFIGLNYYSRVLVKWFASSCYPDEEMTGMPYAIYPAGLYYAIRDVAQVGLPIYITENGIGDIVGDTPERNNARREKWIRGYMKALSLAIEDGYNVLGYFGWSRLRNFEWDWGTDEVDFGHYYVNLTTLERTLKPGARIYAQLIQAARRGDLAAHTADYRTIGAPQEPAQSAAPAALHEKTA